MKRTMQVVRVLFLAITLALLLPLVTAAQQKNDFSKPMTPEQRQTVVNAIQWLEKNPTNVKAADVRTILVRWLIQTPDITITYCPLLSGLKGEKGRYKSALELQPLFSTALLMLEAKVTHITDEFQLVTFYTAGLLRTLRVYERVLIVEPGERSVLLDKLLEKRGSVFSQGQATLEGYKNIQAYVKSVYARKCGGKKQ